MLSSSCSKDEDKVKDKDEDEGEGEDEDEDEDEDEEEKSGGGCDEGDGSAGRFCASSCGCCGDPSSALSVDAPPPATHSSMGTAADAGSADGASGADIDDPTSPAEKLDQMAANLGSLYRQRPTLRKK